MIVRELHGIITNNGYSIKGQDCGITELKKGGT